MMWVSFVAIAFICVCHGQPLEQFAVPLIDDQQAPLTAMIDTSKITTHIAQSLKVPIMHIINTTVEVKVIETVLSLSTDINEIKSNVQLLEQEVKDQREITLKSLNEVKNDSKNYCDSELLSLKEIIESNTNELNTELVAMQENINELSEKLNETLISIRRDITDQISDIQRQLNGLFKTEMKVTSENDRRSLIDCGSLDEGQSSGIYKIFTEDFLDGFYVYCDMETDNGGWTVFQRRLDGETDFYRGWTEYEEGFGDFNREFWLGNSKLHTLTSQDTYELRVDMEDFESNTRYAKFTTFSIGDISTDYMLTISGYSGDAGDRLSMHSGYAFSTKDRDNDISSSNCAETCKGGWWYHHCHNSNLNGVYLNGQHASHGDGIEWYLFKGDFYSLKTTSMMIKRRR